MSENALYRKIIAGRTGPWSLPVRGLLRTAEVLYAGGVSLRNRWYDRPQARTTLPIPVISVGNLTVGGTGKTPFVIELVNLLDRMGRNPVVISRGYGAAGQAPNDEELLIRKRCPGVVCLADPDRVGAGWRAHEVFGADVLVLDDAFQHRRLARVLDIVLVDATCPFGHEHLLPRGLLREPVTSLARADVVVLSRCDQVSPAELARIDARARGLARDAVHIQCSHRVTGVELLDGSSHGGTLDGLRAVLFAGIARPEAFLNSMRMLGVEVVATRFWPDHHRYTLRELDGLLGTGRFPQHDLLITTEKDAVKLADLNPPDPTRIGIARIEIDFAGEGGTMLQTAVGKAAGVR